MERLVEAGRFVRIVNRLNNVIDRVRHSRDTLGEFFDAGTFRRRPGMKYTLERLYNELEELSKTEGADR